MSSTASSTKALINRFFEWFGELECAKTRLGPACSVLTRQPKSRPVIFSKDRGFENGNRGLKYRLVLRAQLKWLGRVAGRKEFLEN
jgi:hypothetical protein